MPWLPLFVDEKDAPSLIRRLSEDSEIAFLLPNGPRCWKAEAIAVNLKDGRYSIWHVPGGPLPLLKNNGTTEWISNPWHGWREESPGADPSHPYFGPGHPSVIWLNLYSRHRPYTAMERSQLPMLNSQWAGDIDRLALTSFEWIGNRYGPKSTHRWWRRLNYWVSKTAVELLAGDEKFWAFPSALDKLKSGMDYYANGFDLTAALRSLGSAPI